jgi:1-phosphatidylinositol-3-phosphate 5-kinase
MDSDTEDETELQDTGQLYPNTLLSDDLIEQGEGSLIRVEECQLSDIAIADYGATFLIPADQNISSGYSQLETLEDSKEKTDATNIISDSDVSYEQHQEIISDNHFTETKRGGSVENADVKQSGVIDVEKVTSLPMAGGDIIRLNEQVMDRLDSTMENTIIYNNISNTGPDMKNGANFDNKNECPYPLVLPSFDADPLIWLPPEPENKEDDFDTVLNVGDESENYSTGLGNSSLNLNLAERSMVSREDQLQKVMSEVMNGQFKILVSRFLAAEGFSLSDGGTNKNWLDIVASLSWDAAQLVKPDASSGNEMDPGLYVKVKCIASGSYKQR